MKEETGLADPAALDEEVLSILRTPGLSIKNLEPSTKEKIRLYIVRKHIEQGVSLSDIAKLIGNKTSGYTSWLSRQVGVQPRGFEEARLKGIHEKVRKYERRPFDGTDEDKAYMLGLKHGDLYAYTPFGDAVRVSTSTTHPALAELFTRLFSPYGHVYKHPRYKEDTSTYEWNIVVILDKSFGFLLESRDKCREWIASEESITLSYLAGLVDAEGNIRIYPNPRTVGIIVSVWNTDFELVEFVYMCLCSLDSRPLKPYLHRRPGPSSSGFRIAMKRDYWRVLIARFDEAQSLLRRLPLRHHEKVEMKELALSIAKGEAYERIAETVSSLKKSFRRETSQYTKQAELEFLRTHPVQSNPVLCILQRQIQSMGLEEQDERRLVSLRGYLAVHVDELCLLDEPCVMICPGCDETNIVSIILHESIHHALLRIGDELTDPLDDIVEFMRRRGIREVGF